MVQLPRTSDSCASECSGRRAFLREAALYIAAAVGLSAISPFTELSALSLGAPGKVHYPIPTVDSVSIDSGHEVIICRYQGEIFAFALSCPHQNTALRTLPKNGGFQCPRHKSRYQQNGTFINGKATRNMDRLPISRDGHELVVDVTVAYASDTEPAKWASAVVKL